MAERVPLPAQFRDRSFSVGDAVTAGVGEGRLRSADLARPFHGVRTHRRRPQTVEERCRAYEPRLRAGQFFGGLTAAALWGVPLPRAPRSHAHARPRSHPHPHPLDLLHVFSVSPSRPPRTVGVVGHQLSERPPTCELSGLDVTDPAATWLQLAAVLSLDDLVAAGDYFIHDPVVLEPDDRLPLVRPFTTTAELAARMLRFRAAGKQNAVQALPLLRPASESRPESLLRLLLRASGLPEPEVNTVVTDERGHTIGRFDLVFRRWRVIVEYDGEQHRTNTRQYDRDEWRIEAAMHAGWLVVRIRSRALFLRRAETVERVARALRKHGWTGGPK